MNVRQAILAAADHIERNPASYEFYALYVPSDTSCKACMLGWVGYMLGMHGEPNNAVKRRLGLPAFDGYLLISETSGLRDFHCIEQVCKALRAYADKYHPAAPITYPNWHAMSATRTVLPDAVSEEVRV